MNLIKFLLDPRGRISRRQFWYSWIVILVLGIGISQAKDQAGTFLGSVIGLYLTITIYGKRLHDLGRSAWKLSWPFGLTILSVAASGWVAYSFFNHTFGRGGDMQLTYVVMAISSFAPYAIWLIYAFMVGMPLGMSGDNRFGPNPLEQTTLATKPSTE